MQEIGDFYFSMLIIIIFCDIMGADIHSNLEAGLCMFVCVTV